LDHRTTSIIRTIHYSFVTTKLTKMKVYCRLLLFACIASVLSVQAQKEKELTLASPDGNIVVHIEAGKKLSWTATLKGQTVIAPSAVSLSLQGGELLGSDIRLVSVKSESVDQRIPTFHYKKDSITDQYNQLTLTCKGNYGIIFRVYDNGVAYRFFTTRKGELVIQDEAANFNFPDDEKAYIPYVNEPHNHDIYECSFENTYKHIRLSEFVKDTLAFAPVLVELPFNHKVLITEADLESYPGMFLQKGLGNNLHGRYAPYVLEDKQGGHNDLQAFVIKRAGYIARVEGTRSFPWRLAVITDNDKALLNNDLVYQLASTSRVDTIAWIQPGKVAWDWWNDWNISHVDFKAGINTITYKYYIDFAAASHIENILLDEGWADSKDIMKVVPEIDLQEIIDYGKKKHIGVWLWGGWLPLDKKIDEALAHYASMGIKGFKIDFMDRDDQKMVEFYYRMARKAAQYHLMVDFHGAYKPTGLQRTYPNVMNFEGVHGLEQMKWSNPDMPLYDVSIPFIRMVAGPMDYTPGAMRNANKGSFRAVNSMPMSQGTRCHQLAMYVVYEAPFEMLADNPTAYMREPESLQFMASVPTVFDETIALDGKVAEYAVIARRKADTWYIGALGNWEPRDLTIDLSFLKTGNYELELFRDGLNADRDGTDYSKEKQIVTASSLVKIHLAPGGGWAATLKPVH